MAGTASLLIPLSYKPAAAALVKSQNELYIDTVQKLQSCGKIKLFQDNGVNFVEVLVDFKDKDQRSKCQPDSVSIPPPHPHHSPHHHHIAVSKDIIFSIPMYMHMQFYIP